MAKGESSVKEDAVKKKVASIESKLEEFKATSRNAVLVGRIMLLIISVVIIIEVVSLYGIFKDAQNSKDAYAEAAQAELTERILPKVKDNVGDLAENLLPVYRQAFQAEFNEAMPEIAESVSEEINLFTLHVGSNVQKGLEHRFESVLQKQLNIIAQDMPEIKDEEKRKEIMDNILEAAYTAAQHLSSDLFKPQIDALAALNATIESARTPKHIKGLNDKKLLLFTTDKLSSLLMTKMAILEDVFVEPEKSESK